MKKDFKKTINVPLTPEQSLSLVLTQVDKWWSRHFEGSSTRAGDIFTVRFNDTFKTMKVKVVEPGKYVEWECLDQNMEMPDGLSPLRNKREWVGNTLRWEVSPAETGSSITFIHFGLNPAAECWVVCEPGWNQTLESLKSLADNGKGYPFVQLDEKRLQDAKRIYEGGL